MKVLRRSPTVGLLAGLVVTVAAVAAYSWYVTRQISSLRALQSDLVDRNRRNSLQLLRIQNDLNTVALAMRDMVDSAEYPLTAWSAQLDRVRADLDAALRREEAVAVARRTPEQRQYLAQAVTQFWDAADRMFADARSGREREARNQIRVTLQPRQAALATAVARLLVENNDLEDQAARQVQTIYADIQRQALLFLGATLIAIVGTSLYVMRENRRLFAELAAVSEQRHDLAQQLITARESTLREIARELHDEFGQILTAMGSMLARAGKHAPEGSALRADLQEVRAIAQTALDSVRGLSQTLHPSILDDAGLDEAIEWYVSTAERQFGITIHYARFGPRTALDSGVAIHVYRVLQEALNNVARHSGAREAWVRLHALDRSLQLEIEDHGGGLKTPAASHGLGIVTMRERAELVGGTLDFMEPTEGGTLVRLGVPLGRR